MYVSLGKLIETKNNSFVKLLFFIIRIFDFYSCINAIENVIRFSENTINHGIAVPSDNRNILNGIYVHTYVHVYSFTDINNTQIVLKNSNRCYCNSNCYYNGRVRNPVIFLSPLCTSNHLDRYNSVESTAYDSIGTCLH